MEIFAGTSRSPEVPWQRETHLELVRRVGLVRATETAAAESLTEEVGRMLSALLRRLKQSAP